MTAPGRVIVVGATSAIAERCARRWAAGGTAAFVLVGRDVARLEPIAADLQVRQPGARVDCRSVDFESPAAIAALAHELMQEPADVVLIAHGSLPDQAACQQDLAACEQALRINGLSPALFAEAFAGHLARHGRGTLALIGSVAGDRGRQSNYVYGAAKGLLDRYAQGLRHRFAGTGVKIVLAKPGPTDTPMTAHLKARGARLASVDEVAAGLVAAVARGRFQVYLPGRWRWIMLVIRHLPQVVFDRMRI